MDSDFKTAQIVGVIILETKKLHGHTRKGLPIYTFIPLSHHYPMFYVPSSSKAKINQLAVIQYHDWPEGAPHPTGTCIRLLGNVSDSNVYDIALLIKNGLSDNIKSHKMGVVGDTMAQDDNLPLYKNIIVIDPAGSTDCDDGFHIDDEYLYVHIADVDHYFKESGQYEPELLKRITSIYSINNVYHMLPENYASNIISLNKDGVKHTMTVVFRRAGMIFEKIIPSKVTVKWSLTYEQAKHIITDQDNVDTHLFLQLCALSAITGTNDTHKMIEKIMILTNEAVGKFLYDHNTNLSVYCPPPPVSDVPEELRRFGPRAIYSLEQHGHGMMGLEYYTHFTSPIRRYADLVVHRLVKTILDNDKYSSMDHLPDIVQKINEGTLNAKRYYRDQAILKLTRLPIDGPMEAYIIDYRSLNRVSVYIKKHDIVLHTKLFSDELLPIWQATMTNGIIEITKQGQHIEIPMFKSLMVTLTCLPSEIRINQKIRVSFPVISSVETF